MILAVDPGSHGAVAWVFDTVSPIGLVSLSGHDTVQLFLRFQSLSHLAPGTEKRIAFIEDVGGYVSGRPLPGSSMFRFGFHAGSCHMALAALGFEIHKVRPTVWQKAIGCPLKRSGELPGSWKGRLATYAREITPELNARLTRQNADAVLILRYAIKVLDRNRDMPILKADTPTTIIEEHDDIDSV